MPKPPDLISTAEAAKILDRHVRTVHRMVDSGRLRPWIKAPGLRGPMMFRRSDVLRVAAAEPVSEIAS